MTAFAAAMAWIGLSGCGMGGSGCGMGGSTGGQWVCVKASQTSSGGGCTGQPPQCASGYKPSCQSTPGQ